MAVDVEICANANRVCMYASRCMGTRMSVNGYSCNSAFGRVFAPCGERTRAGVQHEVAAYNNPTKAGVQQRGGSIQHEVAAYNEDSRTRYKAHKGIINQSDTAHEMR
jgi:hypothetical protein